MIVSAHGSLCDTAGARLGVADFVLGRIAHDKDRKGGRSMKVVSYSGAQGFLGVGRRDPDVGSKSDRGADLCGYSGKCWRQSDSSFQLQAVSLRGPRFAEALRSRTRRKKSGVAGPVLAVSNESVAEEVERQRFKEVPLLDLLYRNGKHQSPNEILILRDEDYMEDESSASAEHEYVGEHRRDGPGNGAGSSTEAVSQSLMDRLNIPARYQIILKTSLAFVICNMDKVNMSVAIIPMSHQLAWSNATAGLVQSSFFYGYALSQLPGGWLTQRFTGRKVLAAGVLVWSVATFIVPSVAPVLPLLFLSRFLVGLGEGVSPPAAVDLIAQFVPQNERARATAVVFGGLNIGSVLGLLVAPQLINMFGWESVFYLFGTVGILWVMAYNPEEAISPPEVASPHKQSQRQLGSSASHASSSGNGNGAMLREERNDPRHAGSLHNAGEAGHSGRGDPHAVANFDYSANEPIPWRAFLTSAPVLSMMTIHFCGNWGHFTLLSWLPTYFSDGLHLDISAAAIVSILPPLASVAVSSVAAPFADGLISRGTDVTKVRKLCQTIAFVSPAACMTLVSLVPDLNPWAVVALLTAGLSLKSFALAGLYCSHQDISPKYASILLGLTNTVGAIPGIVGVALTGYLYDQTNDWTLSLFAPSIFCYLVGITVWNLFHSSEPIDFNSPKKLKSS